MKFILFIVISLVLVIGSAEVRHPQNETEQVYSSLNSVTLPTRRELFRHLTSQQKSAVWRYHLRRETKQHPELTTEQVAIIQEAFTLATADEFEQRSSLESLTIEIHEAFSGALAREIFAQLGNSVKNHHAVDELGCDCSRTSDYCSTSCFGNGCAVADYGCGTFWVYSCDGLCRVV